MITELVERLREHADNPELDMDCTLSCDGECNKILREAADVIEELSAKIQAANMERSSQYYNGGWIPVSERLPEEKGLYLVSVRNDHKRRYSKTCWFDGGNSWFARQDIIAWMPLPPNYQGNDESEG